jgi:hypothetical protein
VKGLRFEVGVLQGLICVEGLRFEVDILQGMICVKGSGTHRCVSGGGKESCLHPVPRLVHLYTQRAVRCFFDSFFVK